MTEPREQLRGLLMDCRDWFDNPEGEPSSSDLLDRINDALLDESEPGYSPEFTATSRGLTAEALLREAARLARFDGTYDALDLADRIDEFLAEPCSNYTAKSWSPTSPQPEDDRCVNCGHPEAPHRDRTADGYLSPDERLRQFGQP